MSTSASNRRLLAGNWKMNLTHAEGMTLVNDVLRRVGSTGVPVVFGAPAIHLHAVGNLVERHANMHVAGQDVSTEEKGARTGEISAAQLASVGCSYVIIGHSERRSYHGEAGELLAHKVQQALRHNLRPIYCFGETLAQREGGQAEAIVAEQLAEGLSECSPQQMEQVVLAYEPVWAIGTGKTASPAQAQEIHAYIRSWLTERFGEALAANTTILYGGSVKPGNANELFGQADIDGGLIGGASLKADDFVAILQAFE